MTIIGNGNVALDISRVLLKDPSILAPYDAPSKVIDHLNHSSVRSISIVGRRGLVQSSFTIKEIREISRIEGVTLYGVKEEFEKSINE